MFCILRCFRILSCIQLRIFAVPFFVSVSRVIGCEERLQKDLKLCPSQAVKLYSFQVRTYFVGCVKMLTFKMFCLM